MASIGIRWLVPLSAAVGLLVSSSIVDAVEVASFTEPYRDIDVSSPEMGTLATVPAMEGDKVVAGQVVATLDEGVLQASLHVAKKAMEARGKLRSAEVELAHQEERLKKLIGLRQRGHASDEEVTRAKTQREIAAAQVQAVHDELNVKRAEYKRIQTQLTRQHIKSPITGTVTEVYKDAGEFVSPSEPVVLKVVELDPLLGIFSVSAAAARELKRNQSVVISVGSERTTTQGVIEFVSPTADAQSGTTRVKVRIPNSEARIHSGDPCWLKLPAE